MSSFTGSRVPLPRAARPPFEVYVNGVQQEDGVDYAVGDAEIVFADELTGDRVGFWRWVLMFFNIAGTYGGQTVDVRYSSGERALVATGLEIQPPKVGGR
ncbi:MAG: hypothetical protein H0U42_08285 [Thermoleophilaceae bacterium]|nr:hypothetical protein [Thermoleophilaceae bacterium]